METYIIESYLIIKGKREPRTAIFLGDPESNLVEAIVPEFNRLNRNRLEDLSDALTIATLNLKITGSLLYTGGIFSDSDCAFYECGSETIRVVNFSEMIEEYNYDSWEETSDLLIGRRIARALQYLACKTGKKVKVNFLEL
jgi:hypothetical protein